MGHGRKNKLVSLTLAFIMAIAMLGSAPIAAFGEGLLGDFGGAQAAPRAFNDDEPHFQLTVSILEGGTTFILPTSSYLNSSFTGKLYNWSIDWGDGKTETVSGTSSNGGGIPHLYEFAGDHIITITPNGSTEAWLAAFGFAGNTVGSNAPANKDLVTAVAGPLTPQMTRTTAQINGIEPAPNYEWANMFIMCTSLSQAITVESWEQVTSVGSNFATNMFYNCSSLVSVKNGFNLPQSITSTGSFFAAGIFSNCENLVSLPAGFNLPQGITTVGDFFALSMFSDCSNLHNLPDGFNMPQGITDAGDGFAYLMFYACEELYELPEGFNLPQGITKTGGSFVSGFLYECYNLVSLPEGFNLPPNITSVGDDFVQYLFYSCTSLVTLPEGFNLPQGIISVGYYFATGMFIACESLDSLPEGFNLPQNINSTGTDFAAEMFRDAGSPSFQINNEFCFPSSITATTANAFYRSFQLSANAPMQNRTAASIIGDCLTPIEERETFGSCFSDLDFISVNWGGLQLVENEQVFRLTIRTTSYNCGFFLQTSGFLDELYASMPYDWYINWGDGNSGIYSGSSSAYSGITHYYYYAGDYTISIKPNGSTEAWLAAFGFTGVHDDSREYLIAVSGPIKPEMTRTAAQIDGTDAPPNYEWCMTFINCYSLQSIPVFEGWESISSVGNSFAASMYYNCQSLTSLPESYTFPQGITKAGGYFAYQMFGNCESLTTLPDGFNLPQRLTELGSAFAMNLFQQCTSLTSLPDGFNLPQELTGVVDSFAVNLFSTCTSLSTLPDGFNLPQSLTQVSGSFAAGMFEHCESLISLPAGFNLPQGISSVGRNFASRMFYLAGSSSFQLNDGFRFPVGIPADAQDAFYKTFQLSDAAPVQNRTAASIIGGCPTPTDPRDTFDSHFSDLDLIHINWGGLQSNENEQVFRLTISTPVDNSSYILPTSSLLNGTYEGKPYDWNVDWGDGSSEIYTGVSSINSGITHNYSIAGDYTITITPNGSIEAWLGAFGFYLTGIGSNSSINKAMLLGVPSLITPEMTRTTAQIEGREPAPSNEWSYVFYECFSLNEAPGFTGWERVTIVGDYFAAQMFSYCNSLKTLPDSFNLPQELTEVGDFFAFHMFDYCSFSSLPAEFNLPQSLTKVGSCFASYMFWYNTNLTVLPDDFTLPQGITKAGDNFAALMFTYCTSLTTLPDGFNLPQGINDVGSGFAYEMFSNCTSLTRLPEGFNLPQGPTSAGISFACLMFAGCTNLVVLPEGFNLPQGLIVVGGYFAASMFNGCISLERLPEGFNLPQCITEVGNAFAEGMFGNCTSLTALPAGFNLPQDLSVVGDYFADYMLANCTSLTGLPDGFSFPHGISKAGNEFADGMFYNCTRLTALPEGFNLPQGLTEVGGSFAYNMFCFCTSLKALPDGFNLPQCITEVGNSFAANMFASCKSLASLPEGFNLPKDLSVVGDNFTGGMFIGCTSLGSLPEGFSFPHGTGKAGNVFADFMFYNCTSLTALPEGFNLPQGLTEVGDAFARNMFYNCASLTSLPEGFNLPQGINSVGSSFALQMFYLAGSSSFQINDGFRFPAGVPADTELAFSRSFQLSDAAPVQNRSAASIIGDCPTPTDERETFDAHFSDLESIAVNWGGSYTPPSVGGPGTGDLNGDGFVTMDEVMTTAQAAIGAIELSPEQFAAVDMDNDGAITMADVMLVYQAAVM